MLFCPSCLLAYGSIKPALIVDFDELGKMLRNLALCPLSQLSVLVKTKPRKSVTGRNISFCLTWSESSVPGHLVSLLLDLQKGSS